VLCAPINLVGSYRAVVPKGFIVTGRRSVQSAVCEQRQLLHASPADSAVVTFSPPCAHQLEDLCAQTTPNAPIRTLPNRLDWLANATYAEPRRRRGHSAAEVPPAQPGRSRVRLVHLAHVVDRSAHTGRTPRPPRTDTR
jgi:hypothetical protein